MSMSAIDTKVARELSSLVKTGLNIKEDITKCGYIESANVKQFQVLALSILQNRFGENSSYYKEFFKNCQVNISENFNQNVTLSELAALAGVIGEQIGILKAAIYALENGLADDFFYQRETIICNDLLDQAYNFLENWSTYLAAGVYGRIVLETAIREFAKLKQHENYDSKMKFDRLIIKLRTDGFIIQSFEEKLRYNYTIGSDAAHNDPDFTRYSQKDLKQFLTFVKDDVLTLK